MLEVKVDADNVLRHILNTPKHKEIEMKVLNELAEQARSHTKHKILSEYNYPSNKVNIGLFKASMSVLVAILTGSKERLSFMKFGAVQTGTGVEASIKKGKKTRRKKAFIATPQGKDYKNRGQKRTVSGPTMALQRKKTGAYPVRRLNAPSIGMLLKAKKNIKEINHILATRGEAVYEIIKRRVLGI
jgi:hypothetical protein